MPELIQSVLGMDSSHYQDNNSTSERINFDKAYASGARFNISKISQALWADEDGLYNWKSSKAAGLFRGGYHFLTWNENPKLQAEYYWSIIQHDPPELFNFVDFEWWGQSIPENAFDLLWQYVDRLHTLSGKYPGIYTGYYFWLEHGSAAVSWANFPLWLAWYTANFTEVKVPAPWKLPTFWQYTSHGDGLAFGCESKNVDLNYYIGSYESLLTLAGGVQPTPNPIPGVPTLPCKFRVKYAKQALRETPMGEFKYYVPGGTICSGITDIRNTPMNGAWVKFTDPDGWMAITYAGKSYLERI